MDTYSNSIRQKTGEGTGDTGRTKEQSLTILSTITGIPQGDIVGNSRIKTSLCVANADVSDWSLGVKSS